MDRVLTGLMIVIGYILLGRVLQTGFEDVTKLSIRLSAECTFLSNSFCLTRRTIPCNLVLFVLAVFSLILFLFLLPISLSRFVTFESKFSFHFLPSRDSTSVDRGIFFVYIILAFLRPRSDARSCFLCKIFA